MKKAFTLAEVLLTLVIIGVAAAITIPAVVTKVTKDRYVVALKKAHNTIKTAVDKSEYENGPIYSWKKSGLISVVQFDAYFRPYFDIMKDCDSFSSKCFADNVPWLGSDITNISNAPNTLPGIKFMTSDGMAWLLFAHTVNGFDLISATVDTNGLKKPNIFGRDVFTFDIVPSYGVKPNGAMQFSGEVASYASADFTNSYCRAYGPYCAAKVLAENGMNY